MRFRSSRSILCNAAVLLAAAFLTAAAVSAQSSCPAGQFCTVTLSGTTYTVVGPCDTSSIGSISGCVVVGIGPQPGGPPLQVTGIDPPAQVIQDYSAGTPVSNFDQAAQQEIAELRNVPADEINAYWSRGEIRAYLYLRLLQMAADKASGQTLAAADQPVFNYYSNAINTERLAIANEAMSLYNTWNNNKCGFQVPVGDPNAYLNRPDVDNGSVVSPAPCQLLALGPASDACALGYCTPPSPSSDEFTAWAGGVIHQNEVAAWGQSLQNDSYLTLTATQAQQAAADEYDKAFAGILEGLDYLTAKQSVINGLPTNAQTSAQQNASAVWLAAFGNVAVGRAEDLGTSVIQTLFQGAYLDGTESVPAAQGGGSTTLGAKFAATEDEFFDPATDGLEVAIEEDAAGVIAEGFDSVVGPAISAAAIIAYTTWQAVTNAEVPVQLQAAVNCAQFYSSSNPSACDQTTSNPTVATLSDYSGDPNGRQIIMTALVRSTMPDYTAARLAGTTANQPNVAIAPLPGPLVPSDPNFIINGAAASPSFIDVDWGGDPLVTSVANGWFVQYLNNTNSTWLRYVSSLAYTYNANCPTCTTGTELWRTWYDQDKFLAIRVGLQAGGGAVQDATNGCPSFLAPQGENVDLGNVCVVLVGSNTIIQANDTIVINGEARQVSSINTDSSGNQYAETIQPFGDTPSGPITILTNPDSNCLNSNSLSPRTSTPDCISGPTISTSLGTITMNSNVPTVHFDLSSLTTVQYGSTIDISSYFTSNSVGVVTFSLGSGSSGCTVTPGGTVTATGAATCVIQAAQAGAGQYTAPAALTSSFTINPVPLTITAQAASKVYGANDNQSVTISQGGFIVGVATVTTGISAVATGLVNGDQLNSFQAYSDGGAGSAAVGNYGITISNASISSSTGPVSINPQNETNNYTITYVNTAQFAVTPATLNITASNQTKTYGQVFTVPSNGYTTSGLVSANGDTVASVTLTATGTANTATVNGGPYFITPSAAAGTGLGNYTINYHNGTLTINTAPLSVTANSFTKTYGQTESLAGTAFTTQGLLFSTDTVTGVTLNSQGAPATATVAGSPYAVIPSAAVGTGLSNYSITYNNGTLTVNPAPLTLTANNQTKTYGQAFTFAGTEYMAAPLLNNDSLGKITLTSGGAPATAPVSGSPYAIVPTPGSATGAAASNYSITYANGWITVSPAPLTITASNNTMIIGAPVPAITPSYSGFVNNEMPGSLTAQPQCQTTVTSSSPVGTYTNSNTCGGAVDANYAFTYVAGTMKVTYNVPLLTTNTNKNTGSTVPIQVQLQTYSGANLSSPKTVLTVVGLTPSPAPGVSPAGTFTYDSGMYQLNVKTSQYPVGTYTLSFSVSGDPNVHTVTFEVW